MPNGRESEAGYNGWTNRETWAVALWIDNEGYAGGEHEVHGKADEFVKEFLLAEETGALTDLQSIVGLRANCIADLAKWIEEAIAGDREDALGKDAVGLFEDLLDFALTRVDWREIATHYVDESIREEHQLRSAGAAICQALEVAVKEVNK